MAVIGGKIAATVDPTLGVAGGIVAGITAIHSAVASYNAGVKATKAVGERALSRNIVSTAAATAAVVCAATLLNGGGLILAGALTAISLVGSYKTARE